MAAQLRILGGTRVHPHNRAPSHQRSAEGPRLSGSGWKRCAQRCAKGSLREPREQGPDGAAEEAVAVRAALIEVFAISRTIGGRAVVPNQLARDAAQDRRRVGEPWALCHLSDGEVAVDVRGNSPGCGHHPLNRLCGIRQKFLPFFQVCELVHIWWTRRTLFSPGRTLS